jgi:hypothetical protein
MSVPPLSHLPVREGEKTQGLMPTLNIEKGLT